MDSSSSSAAQNLAEAGYAGFAAAFVRGRLGPASGDEADGAAIERGLAEGLRLHRFKRNAELPRVRKVLGILRGLAPASLVDVGSGRGTFLWPLLEALPGVPVTSVERSASRADELAAVRRGGIDGLRVLHADVTRLPLADGAVDVALALEVLEHLRDPGFAVRELARCARRFVVATVPSYPDDNPEHIQLFSPSDLTGIFEAAGAQRVEITGVHGHHVVVARLA